MLNICNVINENGEDCRIKTTQTIKQAGFTIKIFGFLKYIAILLNYGIISTP